jgi:hypothetical protein
MISVPVTWMEGEGKRVPVFEHNGMK